MNNAQRKQLWDAIGYLEQVKEIVDFTENEQREKFDNMNEGLQSTDKGKLIEAEADALADILSEIESISQSINNVIEGELK